MRRILVAGAIWAALQGAARAADPAGVCEPGGWCWASPTPQGNNIMGIWGATAAEVWAVGADGTLLRFDGSQWKMIPVATHAYLGGVWGAAADDVWAVGGDFANAAPATSLHWDGRSWTVMTMPVTDELLSVWGAASNDVWVAGGHGSLVHWDGKVWMPARSPTKTRIWHLSGCAGDDVWAVSNDGVLHFDGQRWSRVAAKALRYARDVACLASGDVMISRDGAVVRGDGKQRWAVQRAVSGASFLSARGPEDVWLMVGGAIDHWDGRSWTRMAQAMAKEIYAFQTVGKDEVWASGQAGTLLRWDGRALHRLDTRFGTMDIASVWGARPDEVWAACEELEPPQARLLRWDGKAWSREAGVPRSFIKKVWGSAADDVWAVGDVILHWDGKTWSRVPAHFWFTLNDVRGLARDDVWAVGEEGVLHWDGKAWTVVEVEREAGLQAVWPSGPDDVWAVGKRTTALRWNGQQWAKIDVPGGNWLWGLWGAGPGDVWAVGNASTVLRLTSAGGVSRVPIPRGDGNDDVRTLWAIWGAGPNAIWAAGVKGTIIRWNGKAWRGGPTLAQFDLKALWGDAAGVRWAVGDKGTMLSHAAGPPPQQTAAPSRPPAASRPVVPSPAVRLPAMSDPPADPRAPPPAREQGLRLAREWWDAARDRRAGDLRRRSVFPLVVEGFDFGGAMAEECGAPGPSGNLWGEELLHAVRPPHSKGLRAEAKDDESFLSALDCFFRDDYLPRYSPQSDVGWRSAQPPGDVTGALSIVTASSMSRRMARYRKAIAALDRTHLLVQAVMTDNDGVTNTAVMALRLVDGAPRVAAVYIDEAFEE